MFTNYFKKHKEYEEFKKQEKDLDKKIIPYFREAKAYYMKYVVKERRMRFDEFEEFLKKEYLLNNNETKYLLYSKILTSRLNDSDIKKQNARKN